MEQNYISVTLCIFVQIMKDIANRYKLLRGYRIHYFPGWDCHGMPIEQKALAEARTDDVSLTALELRDKGLFFFLSFLQSDVAISAEADGVLFTTT